MPRWSHVQSQPTTNIIHTRDSPYTLSWNILLELEYRMYLYRGEWSVYRGVLQAYLNPFRFQYVDRVYTHSTKYENLCLGQFFDVVFGSLLLLLIHILFLYLYRNYIIAAADQHQTGLFGVIWWCCCCCCRASLSLHSSLHDQFWASLSLHSHHSSPCHSFCFAVIRTHLSTPHRFGP